MDGAVKVPVNQFITINELNGWRCKSAGQSINSFLPPFHQWDFVSKQANPPFVRSPSLVVVCWWNTSVCLPVAVVVPFCTRSCLYKYYILELENNAPQQKTPRPPQHTYKLTYTPSIQAYKHTYKHIYKLTYKHQHSRSNTHKHIHKTKQTPLQNSTPKNRTAKIYYLIQ